MAGNNLLARFWRFSYPVDDGGGGAVPSGTIIYQGIEGRVQDAVPDPAFAMQGVEIKKTFMGEFRPGTLDIREYDQCEITSPPNHPYYGLMLRIDSVQKPNFHPADPRGHLLLIMTRATRHNNPYQ